jgi:hypothetical protein
MGTTQTMGLTLEATDVSQQKLRRVSNIQPDVTVQEVLEPLLAQMNLPQNDPDGRPVSYQALLEREGRHLQSWEKVGDALKTGDRLVLQPNIDAGGCCRS